MMRSLFRTFKKRITYNQNKNHLVNLCALALSDGKFDDIEQQYIISIGNQLGITEEEGLEIIDYCKQNPVVIKTKKSLFGNKKLSDYFALVIADGIIHPNEVRLIEFIGEKWGYDESQVNKLLTLTKSYFGGQITKLNIKNRLTFLLEEYNSIFNKISSGINNQVSIFAM
ncbi:tellurite resistance TerB family protein [Marinigracilibium pacificum]|uniref:TerB family tellurite resistance protein n=1 Tax=Marinigracilibium pacificum TaxID=2729599 RepID=A0A848J1H9_9BACT|nr:TerB family tellurite resistance protein [Marinigracilibium pacificum]NMM48400.1 TerB family tellurite resistance protein [Marinigracilibium pacificum]